MIINLSDILGYFAVGEILGRPLLGVRGAGIGRIFAVGRGYGCAVGGGVGFEGCGFKDRRSISEC